MKVTDSQVLTALRKHNFRRVLACQELRISGDTMRGHIRRLKQRGFIVRGDPAMGYRNTGESYEPTPEEIAAACAKIQAGWSRSDELRHRGIFHDEFTGVEIREVGDPQGGNAYLVEVEW